MSDLNNLVFELKATQQELARLFPLLIFSCIITVAVLFVVIIISSRLKTNKKRIQPLVAGIQKVRVYSILLS